ncbi:MAG: chemotaxis protein CheC [Coriobacteriia bacterium]|nr:chemotaxis protein CheC [Coriobacteriia bacterium]MBN2840790.1 chemotaxis protein CheC [Coriobacteriia bacterium]
MDPRTLTELQLDALGEVGSIGAGHAATALSQMLGTPVDIDVPDLKVLSVSEVPGMLGGPENLVGAVYSRLLGDLNGGLLFIVGRDALLELSDLLRSRTPGTSKSLGPAEEATVTHAATVLIAAYLAAVARLTGLSTLPGPSEFAFDMLGAILEGVTVQVGLKAENAILVLTRFSTTEICVDASLFYLPDPDSLEVMLGRLGVL